MTLIDAAQIMAFSAIMLTTDAHNPRVVEKMTKPQFVTLTRGMNGSGNFPKVFRLFSHVSLLR